MNALILALSLGLVCQAPAPAIRRAAANPAVNDDFQSNIRKVVEKRRLKRDQREAAGRARAAAAERAYRMELEFELKMAPYRFQEAHLQLETYRNQIAAANAANYARMAYAYDRMAQTYSWYGLVTYDSSSDAIIPYGMSPIRR
jgi:hypothetical protein